MKNPFGYQEIFPHGQIIVTHDQREKSKPAVVEPEQYEGLSSVPQGKIYIGSGEDALMFN